MTGVPGAHAPAWQASLCVQALPSSQVVPSGFGETEQVPVAGLQTPALVHAPAAAQTTGAPAHVPAWQTSFCVQAVPSSQVVPSGFAAFEQAPVAGLQTPAAWH